jgi:hypothetical protein
MSRSICGQALVIGRSSHSRSPDWENLLAFTARRRRRPPSSEQSIPSPMRQATSFCNDARDLPVIIVTARRRGRPPPSVRSDLPNCEPPAGPCRWKRRSPWQPRSSSRRPRLRHTGHRQPPARSRRDLPHRIASADPLCGWANRCRAWRDSGAEAIADGFFHDALLRTSSLYSATEFNHRPLVICRSVPVSKGLPADVRRSRFPEWHGDHRR